MPSTEYAIVTARTAVGVKEAASVTDVPSVVPRHTDAVKWRERERDGGIKKVLIRFSNDIQFKSITCWTVRRPGHTNRNIWHRAAMPVTDLLTLGCVRSPAQGVDEASILDLSSDLEKMI